MSLLKVNQVTDLGGDAPTIPAYPGQILQVVSTTKTNVFSSGISAGGDVAISGLTATITPISTSSKILVTVNVSGSSAVGNYGIGLMIFRNGTKIALGDADGSRPRMSSLNVGGTSADGMAFVAMTHLDSPSSTSALTYSTNAFWYQTSGSTIFVNRTATDGTGMARAVSSITLMEVAG